MKTWNDASDEHAPLLAPPRRPAADGGGIRIRPLVATLVTCMAIFGLNAVSPHVRNWNPPTWRRPTGSRESQSPFEWSQVRLDFWYRSWGCVEVWCRCRSLDHAIIGNCVVCEDCMKSKPSITMRRLDMSSLLFNFLNRSCKISIYHWLADRCWL